MRRPATSVPRLVRLGHGALVAGLLLSVTSGALLVATTPAQAAESIVRQTTSGGGDSAVTVKWIDGAGRDSAEPDYAQFEHLSVSVSQTRDLTNQGVRISWAGAAQTSGGDYSYDYLQVMQCWGDASDQQDASQPDYGPVPQHCQYGTPNSALATQMGYQTASRDLTTNQDPEQTYSDDIKLPPSRDNPNRKVYRYPYVSVTGESSFDPLDFFNPTTSNEQDALRTGADGTGTSVFELQTDIEAPHMGCGADEKLADGTIAPRSCWLVVVPRGETSVDHTPAAQGSGGRLYGSALSASAWRNRMVVKMDFQSIASSCRIGADERRVVGSELIADAMTSWQSALCGLGTTYGYSQIGDSQARTTITTTIDGGSKLAFVSKALDATATGDATIDYAPVAQTSLVVGYNIDYLLSQGSSNYAQNGTPVQDLTLNARLVAKLLTQSYQSDVPGRGADDTTVQKNPYSLVQDPEFVALNPNFAGFPSFAAPDGLMVALGSSDANALVWSWLRSDPLAKSFLAGKADDWGMRINPSYASLHLDTDTSTDSFPKADLTTYQVPPAPAPGYGTLDMRPYMNDMHEGALRTLRGDANVKTTWDITKLPPAYISGGAQLPGQRFELTLTDAAAAARYGLNVAKLVNGAGQAVAPTNASVQASIEAMATKNGVKVADPSVRTVGAYPLAEPVYAAVNVCAASKAERSDYAKLITYAAGTGQVSGDARGQLPEGYVPLTTAEAKSATTTVATLTKEASGAGDCDKPTSTSTPTPPPTDDGSDGDGTPPPPLTPPVSTTDVPPVTTPTEPVSTPSSTPAAVIPAKPQSTTQTPFDPGRLALGFGVVLGLVMTVVGPLLTRHGRRLRIAAQGAARGL